VEEKESGERIKNKASKDSKRSDQTRLGPPPKGEKEQTEGRRTKRSVQGNKEVVGGICF
jgi:hypothetical protein